ncbi:hypothetical protein F5Y13DRAFT_191042 [Hypoxylon sp. FL1857]|nr:hypothetical protein F5Y13DRAFT_191042 [Hypoxylon sp. FL1857]
MPPKDSITLGDGTKLTTKEVELMFATLKYSHRSLKGSVNWRAVSQKIGYSSEKSARDRLSHVGQKFGWFQEQEPSAAKK